MFSHHLVIQINWGETALIDGALEQQRAHKKGKQRNMYVVCLALNTLPLASADYW